MRNPELKSTRFITRKRNGKRGPISPQMGSDLFMHRTPDGNGSSCGRFLPLAVIPFHYLLGNTTTLLRAGHRMASTSHLFRIVAATLHCGYKKGWAADKSRLWSRIAAT